ncbi:diphthine--ammonia ligase [Candidatus Woesearchaeota archaeon]|nr:diphthine--ammonia ligase [Candidatus Woesearchaeota archaeon]
MTALTEKDIEKWQKRVSKYKITPENKKPKEEIKKELTGLLASAVSNCISKDKIGVLFSGGIDSVLIAKILQDLEIPFTCYTAGLDEPGLKESEDIVWAKKAAKKLRLKLKVKKVKLKEVPSYIQKIVSIINDTGVVKVGVALPLYLASELAKKDGVKIMFSGLGSEEIFAGYERHEKSKYTNKECLNGLKNMDKRDLERDYAITKSLGQEVCAPLLDDKLVDYSLKIPSKYKIVGKHKKAILREVAQEYYNIPKDLAWRPKKAAQYGSGFDKAIAKLTKRNGFKYKSDYLNQFIPKKKLGALVSGGKDSLYSMYMMQKKGYDIACIITLKSKNPDSYMLHTPNIDLVKLQSKAMKIPLVEGITKGEKEKELKDIKNTIKKAKEKYDIQGVTTGALYSKYQKDRIEKICKELDLEVFSPLWHMDQETEMRSLLKEGFEIIFSSVAAYGLDKSWLGKKITQKNVDKLVKINKEIGINIAGEGGEFESLVLDCPLFKEKLKIADFEIIEEDKHTAKMVVKNAVLVKKRP